MMAKYKSRLSKEKFSEYLKLGLALNITKRGLSAYVEKETYDFHRTIVQEFCGKRVCSECRIENILDCPTAGLCTTNHCSFHNSSMKQPRKCPNGSCNIIRDKIRDTFRQHEPGIPEPSWNNTNSQLWSTDAFQVMKCFLPWNKYQNVETLNDVDLHGLIYMILNNKRFENIIPDYLNENDNIYMKASEIERNYRKSNSLSISEWQFSTYLKELIKLLTGTKSLLHDQGIQQAVAKLEQMRSKTLLVNKHTITEVLFESIHSITEEGEEQAKQRGKSRKNNVKKNTEIRTLKLNVLKSYSEIFSLERENIKICHLESIIAIKCEAFGKLCENTKKLQKSEDNDTETGVTQRKRLKCDGNNPTSQSLISEKSYDELRAELKGQLVQFYLERYNTIPLSPLIQRNKASLLDFYVQPAITVVDQSMGLFDRKKHVMYRDVVNLEAIFEKEKDELYRHICLTAPPGAGKTTFVKYLALTWCRAQRHDQRHLSREQKYMKQFDFVFFLSLRDARQECEQDEMIQIHVLSQLDQVYIYTDDFLQNILHKERCLILMDGLDEWKHPQSSVKYCKFGRSRSDFPHMKTRIKCTNLTTSRPWALNNASYFDFPFDQRLEIQGLGKESSKQLVGKVLCHLTRLKTSLSQTGQEMLKKFFEMLSIKRLRKFESNPVILMQLLCLWLEGTDPGESQCEIYSNILELLFRRAEATKKYRKTGKHQMKLPNCFSNNVLCKRNAKLLLALAKLAFATLFSERGESVYVFDRFIANTHMQDHDIQRCLDVGFLSQKECQGKLANDNIQLSFLHKTFQEFFAALSIAAKPESMREVVISNGNETVHKSLQHEILLVFLSGFAPEIASELTAGFRYEISKSSITRDYRETIGTMFLESRLPLNEYSNMITNCVSESVCNYHDQLRTFHIEDIFIDEQCMDMKHTHALKTLIEMNGKHIKSLTIHVKQTVDYDNTNRILNELNIQTICNLQKLFVWGDIPRTQLQSLLQLSKFTTKCLELWGMQLFSEDIIIISEMKNLENISFLSISMTHSVFESLVMYLSQTTKVSQLCLHDMECMDHHENCKGFYLRLQNQSRLVLLLLDKVILSRIHFNGERLSMCVVEWLPIPGSLVSLLQCLSSSKAIERFDIDGSPSQDDTGVLVQTISSMTTLKYLRLRNIDLSKFPLDLSRLQCLKTVYFTNVSIESALLQKIAEDLRGFPSSVMLCLDNCKINPTESYQQVKQHLRSSEEIKIILDKQDGFKQFHIKTKTSDTTLNIAQVSEKQMSDWEQCFCEDSAYARNVAEGLIKSRNFPEQHTLNKLCKHFGRKDKLITTLCTELGTSIKNKSAKIVQVIPSYYKKNEHCEHIIFVICTKGALTRTEAGTIKKYSHKIRPIGKYSLEGKTVLGSKMFHEKNLSLKELQSLQKCINKVAETLLSKHKMLSVIAPSPVRSKLFGSQNAQIIRETCIVLYVQTKNCIPIDEEPFDNFYEGFPIDVREGCFMTHPTIPFDGDGLDNLKMGCSIGSDMCNNAGTLGGFIDHPTYGLCGLTCAHVLLNDHYMNDLLKKGSIIWPHFHPFERVIHLGRTRNIIGRLVQAVYTKCAFDQSGIEVAVFQIESRNPITGTFQGNADIRFDSGKSHGLTRISNVPVVKIGSTTQKTTGQFIMSESATTVRTFMYDMTAGGHVLTLHNQLEVLPNDGDKFSDSGDSGSLVFMKRSLEDNEYVCVGMVEGGTSYGTSIVTPILPILKACGVDSFKSFETAKLSQDLKNVETEITSKLQSLESRIGQFSCEIMQELRDMKSRMPSETTSHPS